MRLTRVRFTVRWLILAVAIVAVSIGAEGARRRCAFYRERAAYYAKLEKGMLWLAEKRDAEVARGKREIEELRGQARLEKDSSDVARLSEQIAGIHERWNAGVSEDAEGLRQSATRYAKLKDRYQRAASRPWLRFEPDPAELE